MGDRYESMKRRVATWAADEVEDGMVVGLGTGSTAAYAIAELGQSVDRGLDIEGIPTSWAARERALDAGIPLTELDVAGDIHLAIDGADQVADGVLIKGGGGAHTRERLVAAAADRFVVICDERKVVERLTESVPLEVLPAAVGTVRSTLDDLGATPTVRSSAAIDGPAYTERGNLLLDADFGALDDPSGLARRLEGIPGVVDHGLFVELADVIAIGTADGVRLLE